MNRINLGRVVLGGIVAGIVISIFEGVLNGVVLAVNQANCCFQRMGTRYRSSDGLVIRIDEAAVGRRSKNGDMCGPGDLGNCLCTR
jgi:hypothetical protein